MKALRKASANVFITIRETRGNYKSLRYNSRNFLSHFEITVAVCLVIISTNIST